MDQIILRSIGHVSCPRDEAKDDFWGNVISTIKLDPSQLRAEATLGLTEFSHIDVIFYLDRVPDEKILKNAGHPRGNPDWPLVGILAQRKKERPNKIGISVCELLEVNGLELKVRALDAIDGTPILDIKPHIKEFVPSPEHVRQPRWATELMKDYFS